MTRKERSPIGTVMAMPCSTLPVLPPVHRHIVEGKGERAEGGVKNTAQGTFLPHGADAGPIIGSRRPLGPWHVAYRFRPELVTIAMALFLE